VLPNRNEKITGRAFSDGRRFRIVAIVDDFMRECLALVPETSLYGARSSHHDRVRQGTELTACGSCSVRRRRGQMALHRTVQATAQNAFIESFNGRLRDPNKTLVTSLAHGTSRTLSNNGRAPQAHARYRSSSKHQGLAGHVRQFPDCPKRFA
jgi:hypothetical protein